MRAHVVGGFVRDMLLGRREPRRRRRRRGRRRRVRRGGREPPRRARSRCIGGSGRPCSCLGRDAARRRHERAHRVLHAARRAADGGAQLACGRTSSGATSPSTRWRRASTRSASARSPTRSAGCATSSAASCACCTRFVRRGPDARVPRRALRAALRLRDRAGDRGARPARGRDGHAGRGVRRAHPRGAASPSSTRSRATRRSRGSRSSARWRRSGRTAWTSRRALVELRETEEVLPTVAAMLPRAPNHRVALLVPLAVAARRPASSSAGCTGCASPRPYLEAMLAVVTPRQAGGPLRCATVAGCATAGCARCSTRCRPRRSRTCTRRATRAPASASSSYGREVSRVRLAVSGDDLRAMGVDARPSVLCYPEPGPRGPSRRQGASDARPNSTTSASGSPARGLLDR